MNIIAVDDERRALHTLEQAIQTALPDMAVTGFTNIIFVTVYSRYTGDALTLRASGYVVSRRSALCSNNETAAVIWENEAGIHDLLVKQRGFLGIAVDKVSCDFYDFCAGIDVNSYKGEFMNQYSWAEFTNAYLSW
jgi:hypothetical protein